MHYCTMLFTKDIPSDEQISEILAPFYGDNLEFDDDGNVIGGHPVFTYDWYSVGGRYGGALKLKVNDSDEKYRWNFYEHQPRCNRLFFSSLIDYTSNQDKSFLGKKEEDMFPYMGMRDGFIYVDGGYVKDLMDFEEVCCYACIDVNGNAIARSSWNGTDFITDNDFDKKLNDIKNNSSEYFVTILDIHD